MEGNELSQSLCTQINKFVPSALYYILSSTKLIVFKLFQSVDDIKTCCDDLHLQQNKNLSVNYVLKVGRSLLVTNIKLLLQILTQMDRVRLDLNVTGTTTT